MRIARVEDAELLAGCTRRLAGRHVLAPAQHLATLQAYAEDHGLEVDRYGDDGVTRVLRDRLAQLFDVPAAVWVPTGTMAQQVALRIWSEDAGTPTVALHHTSHLLNHEEMAHEHLSGLRTLIVGDPWLPRAPIVAADLEHIADPVAALVVEVPQRQSAARLPDRDQLDAIATWARDRGTALHGDGARIWEASAGYGLPVAEVAATFDSVYTSFYKGLGAPAGSALLGSEAFVARARTWIHRYGGQLFQAWPLTVAALRGLDHELPEMPRRLAHARAIADAARGRASGLRLDPDPPEIAQFDVHLEADPDRVVSASADIARERDVNLTSLAVSRDVPGWCSFEVSVGPATLELEASEAADLLVELLERATG